MINLTSYQAAPSKSRAKATFFAQFLGMIGVHKFYLGKTVPGVIYLVFCWTGIPSIIALIETIMMVSMSDYDFAIQHDPTAASHYQPSPVSPDGKKRTTAALLAMFLGAFGVHHFYLKKNTRGLVFLALILIGVVAVIAGVVLTGSRENAGLPLLIAGNVIIFIPAIMGFIDYIRLVMMKDQEFLAQNGGLAYSAPAAVYPAPEPVQGSYGQAWEEVPAWNEGKPAEPYLPNAETVAFQNPVAPLIPIPPLVPEAPPQTAPETSTPAGQAPKFFDNSYMPAVVNEKEGESYVPGDDNYHPSVLQMPDVTPATQMGAGGGHAEKVEAQGVNIEKAARPCLRNIKGEYEGQYIEMDAGEICIGRDPNSCQLVFSQDSPFVSGKHCVISYNARENAFYLQDLGSTNGTFLTSDEKLVPGKFYILQDGDGFYLGDKNASFEVAFC